MGKKIIKTNWWYEFLLWLQGWRTIQEFRISKGVARWTSNFAAPTEKYGTVSTTCTGCEATKLILHMDGNNGSVTFPDTKNFTLGHKDFTIDFYYRHPEINQFLTRRFLRRE